MATKTITRLASFKEGNKINDFSDVNVGDYLSSIATDTVVIVTHKNINSLNVVVLYSSRHKIGTVIKTNVSFWKSVEEVLLRTEKVKTNGK